MKLFECPRCKGAGYVSGTETDVKATPEAWTQTGEGLGDAGSNPAARALLLSLAGLAKMYNRYRTGKDSSCARFTEEFYKVYRETCKYIANTPFLV